MTKNRVYYMPQETEHKYDFLSNDDTITVATSIAPRGIEKQLNAIDSWRRLGLQIISVNSSDEIEYLCSIFSEVTFIQTDRTAADILGKPFIYVDDLLKALRATCSRICGIINSDIILNNSEDILQFLRRECRNTLIYGQRNEIETLSSSNLTPYYYGRDYFFFEKGFIDCIPSSNFFMGTPWWDWWFPLIAVSAGIRLVQPLELIAHHLSHRQAWEANHYAYTCIEITRLINEHCFLLKNDINYSTAENLLLQYGKDAGMLHLIIDHLSSRTTVLSISGANHFFLRLKPAWRPFRPVLSVLISQVSNKDLLFLVNCILELENQAFSDEMEIVIFVGQRTNAEFLEKIDELRYSFWNITCIFSETIISNSSSYDLSFRLARGQYFISLDSYIPFVSDDLHSQCMINSYYSERFNKLLCMINSACIATT